MKRCNDNLAKLLGSFPNKVEEGRKAVDCLWSTEELLCRTICYTRTNFHVVKGHSPWYSTCMFMIIMPGTPCFRCLQYTRFPRSRHKSIIVPGLKISVLKINKIWRHHHPLNPTQTSEINSNLNKLLRTQCVGSNRQNQRECMKSQVHVAFQKTADLALSLAALKQQHPKTMCQGTSGFLWRSLRVLTF